MIEHLCRKKGADLICTKKMMKKTKNEKMKKKKLPEQMQVYRNRSFLEIITRCNENHVKNNNLTLQQSIWAESRQSNQHQICQHLRSKNEICLEGRFI